MSVLFAACDKGNDPVSGTTQGQDDGVYRVNDFWPDEENPEGIVFYIEPESSTDGGVSGTSGWIMGLKQAPEVTWCTERIELDYGTNSATDGRINMAAQAAFEATCEEKYKGKFELFNWCRETYDENWYIPSLQEMRRFMAVYTGLTPEQTAEYMAANPYDILPREIWVGEPDPEDPDRGGSAVEVRFQYSKRIADHGGDHIHNHENMEGEIGPQYWTSTNYDLDFGTDEADKPWYMDFLGGWGSAGTQGQSDGHFTRAMRRF